MKTALILVGSLIAVVGALFAVAGGILLILMGSDGYFEGGSERVSVESSAIVSGRQQVNRLRGLKDPDDPSNEFAIRIRAESADPKQELFIGVAPREALAAYTQDARLDLVYDIEVDPTRITTIPVSGARDLDPPKEQAFWVASVVGRGEQELVWKPESDDLRVFVMNADGSPGLDADVSVGFKVDLFLTGAVSSLRLGLVTAGLGALTIIAGTRRRKSPVTSASGSGLPTPPSPPAVST